MTVTVTVGVTVTILFSATETEHVPSVVHFFFSHSLFLVKCDVDAKKEEARTVSNTVAMYLPMM